MPFWYLGLPIGSKNREGGGWRDGKLWLTIFKKYLQIGKLNFSILATCWHWLNQCLGVWVFTLCCCLKFQILCVISWKCYGLNSFGKGIRWKGKYVGLNGKQWWCFWTERGLGFGILKAFNLTLLQKWKWQFLADNGAIWVKMIKSMHGSFGGRGWFVLMKNQLGHRFSQI